MTERDATICRLFLDENLGYGEIAARLGISKGAVAGVCYRAGLRRGPSKPRRSAVAAEANPAPTGAPHEPATESPVHHPSAAPADRDANGCRYPFGDVKSPGFHFCGVRREPGRPYCAEHVALCYVPASSAEGRRELKRFTYLANNRSAGRESPHLVPAT